MSEIMLSAGIDIGTTTTQVIFSRLTLEKSGGFGTVPEIHVTNREVIYKGKPHFTPLINNELIDSTGVGEIIENEYASAGMSPEKIETGAVIITGETARKRNAREVSETVSRTAGDFVVASCGPDLESFLAGKGAGADILSKKTGKIVLNIDIGGGTSNFCEFQDGEEIDNACIDIGGRIIRFDDDTKEIISKNCRHHVDVQIYFGDGLCSPSIAANIPDMYPALKMELEAEGFSVGTPFEEDDKFLSSTKKV